LDVQIDTTRIIDHLVTGWYNRKMIKGVRLWYDEEVSTNF